MEKYEELNVRLRIGEQYSFHKVDHQMIYLGIQLTSNKK